MLLTAGELFVDRSIWQVIAETWIFWVILFGVLAWVFGSAR